MRERTDPKTCSVPLLCFSAPSILIGLVPHWQAVGILFACELYPRSPHLQRVATYRCCSCLWKAIWRLGLVMPCHWPRIQVRDIDGTRVNDLLSSLAGSAPLAVRQSSRAMNPVGWTDMICVEHLLDRVSPFLAQEAYRM